MSNKPAVVQSTTTTTDPQSTAPMPGVPVDAPIRIRHVRFNSKGVIIASPKEAEDAIPSREKPEHPTGYDITYYPGRRAFRFDRFDGGQYRITKWIPENNIHNYEEWEPSTPLYPKIDP